MAKACKAMKSRLLSVYTYTDRRGRGKGRRKGRVAGIRIEGERNHGSIATHLQNVHSEYEYPTGVVWSSGSTSGAAIQDLPVGMSAVAWAKIRLRRAF